MKRVLFLGILILFSIYSCKKEKEGLALFVIGNWKSQELTLVTQSEGVPSPVGFYTINIKDDDTYVLTFEGFAAVQLNIPLREMKFILKCLMKTRFGRILPDQQNSRFHGHPGIHR